MPRFVPSTFLWRYVAHTDGGVFELEPVSAATASRALDKARFSLEESDLGRDRVKAETIARIRCSIEGCLGHASSLEAGRYLCASCAEWYAPSLF